MKHWQLVEVCVCGGEFKAKADSDAPAVVGLVRMRHMGWVEAHSTHKPEPKYNKSALTNELMNMIAPEVLRQISVKIDEEVAKVLNPAMPSGQTWGAGTSASSPTITWGSQTVTTSSTTAINPNPHVHTVNVPVPMDDPPPPPGKVTGVLRSKPRRVSKAKGPEISTEPPGG